MSDEGDEGRPLPRVLALLWDENTPPRRSAGLSRDRIIAAAMDLADADGLGALSMAKLAERLGCGTMSLYRHVSNKDELLVFMLSAAASPPPAAADSTNWRGALTDWANGLWEVYHRHPWVLQASSARPPADPGQVAWLDAGLASLGSTALSERDKLSTVLAVLHFARGAAALAIETGAVPDRDYPELLKRLIDETRFPALFAALRAGAFDDASSEPLAVFHTGLSQLLDGVAVRPDGGI
jgi:AcrR family transcriptional regulator